MDYDGSKPRDFGTVDAYDTQELFYQGCSIFSRHIITLIDPPLT